MSIDAVIYVTIEKINIDKDDELITLIEKEYLFIDIENYLVDFYSINGAKSSSNVYEFFEKYWQDPYDEQNPLTIKYKLNNEYVIVDDKYYDDIFDKYYSNKEICSLHKCFNDNSLVCETCHYKYCDQHKNNIQKCKSCKKMRCTNCLKNPIALKEKKSIMCTRCNNY